MAQSRELTPDERAKPYAKYCQAPLGDPDAGLLTQLRPEAPIDPALALLPERISDLLEPGYLPCETGWCILPNGAGYAAVNVRMPDVTVEMVNWWFAWHGLEDLRYKLWYPPAHLGISIDEKDRAKVLDPSTPMTERFQGLCHHVLEDVGAGVQEIDICFLRPEDMGFDLSRFARPNVGTVVGANGFAYAAGAPPDAPPEPAIMCHFIREIEGGIEFRTRFWLGCTIKDGVPVCVLPPGVRIPEMVPFGIAQHDVHEYSNLRAFLPSIYAEQATWPARRHLAHLRGEQALEQGQIFAAEAVSAQIKQAFAEHPNRRASPAALREVRTAVTVAVLARMDDLDEVTRVVDSLLSLLVKAYDIT